eukprot:CAMPEP_0172717560 /NCGR_PEP_ID=MMETSP1074-20121228/71780_1 /TAXON_ID=2916 /ORGANISM="Ceratium fusus, Strain PA161109" /LENGTH=72 /DNA_ID=CAMNT_0013542523 /DNA_START=92 /DNA_END=306 /DNA_ORIENTATION=-
MGKRCTSVLPPGQLLVWHSQMLRGSPCWAESEEWQCQVRYQVFLWMRLTQCCPGAIGTTPVEEAQMDCRKSL